MELLSYPFLDAQSETEIRSFLAEVTIVGITREVKERAIELGRRHELKLPDAIIAATALAIDAELLSNDRTLRRIPQLRLRSVALKTGT